MNSNSCFHSLNNVIFTDSVKNFRQRLENEDELNALKNFSCEDKNIFLFYFEESFLEDPKIFADKIKILIDKGFEPLKNGRLKEYNVVNKNEYFIELLKLVPAEKLEELNIKINNDKLLNKLISSRNLESEINKYNNYDIINHIRNLPNLLCHILTYTRWVPGCNERRCGTLNDLINKIRYIYDNIYGRNPPRCILDIDLNQEIIDALNREFPPNGLESLNINSPIILEIPRIEIPVRRNVESNNKLINVKIPTKLANVDINNEQLSNEFFNFIMKKYKPGITNKFSIQGESGVDVGGISRIVYNKFTEIYYKKYFKEYNGFYMAKFPVSEDMKKATKIIISLAEKNNVKFLVPIPTTLYYLLSLPILKQLYNNLI
jgi:hypothetical protein